MVLSSGLFFGGRKRSGPRGYRAYAVGDIHGRLDLLDEMLAKIEADIAARPPANNVLIFLGDLIDRGPQSAQVVERLRHYSRDDLETVFLMGNHEEVFLRVLEGDPALLRDWLKFGGAECIRSYDVDPDELKAIDPSKAVERLREVIPPEHVEFIRSFADTLSFGSYVFVHAGIRPGVTLGDQDQKDLRWIRQPFLDDPRDHGMTVVHGHTITPAVDECSNRIGLDTGAYRTGVLTAMAVEGTERWLLQTGDVIVPETDIDRVSESSAMPALAGGQ